jgi:hypothetical protein
MNKNIQIEVLERVKQELECRNLECLCELINNELEKKLEKSLFYADINKYIPLFTYENAVKHADALEGRECRFWWSYWREFDYENRIKFIDWIIEELKK